MPQRYPGEQCTSGGQKTHPGSSGRPHLPRDHNAVPQWERLRIIVPPLIVQSEVLTGTPSRVNHP